jgi:hypothetical protein
MSVPSSFAKGFVWGAAISAVVQLVGWRRILITLGVVLTIGFIANLAQVQGAKEGAASGVTIEIVGFNSPRPGSYDPTAVVRVTNPSKRVLNSFSAKCANIEFDADRESVLPGHEALIEVDFFRGTYESPMIDPRDPATVSCQFTDADFE